MKKIIISVFLVFTLFSLVACNKETKNNSLSLNPQSLNEKAKSKRFAKTDKTYFILDGRSDYKIVYDFDGPALESYAVSELSNLLYEGCKLSLEFIDSKTLTKFDESDRYIVVGNNNYTALAGITVDFASIGTNGFHVETKGDSVFIVGGGDWGTIWGVYGFLEKQLDYHCYYDDELYFNEELCQTSELVKVNFEEVPSIEWRVAGDGEGSQSRTLRTRLRMQDTWDVWCTSANISFVHTWFRNENKSFGLVPVGECLESHPEWYSSTGCPASLCFTRDPEGLSDFIVQKMLGLVDMNPGIKAINFSQPDNMDWCYCDSCRAVMDKYGGAPSSTMLKFLQILGPKFKQACEESGRPTDVIIYGFAYWATLVPPSIRTQEDINYFMLPDNVGIQFAPINKNHKFAYTDPEVQQIASYMDTYKKICKHFAVWEYEENYGNYMHPYDSWNKITSSIQFYAEAGGKLLYNLMAYDNMANSDWSRLHMYVEAMQEWNCNLNTNDLIEDFMNHYYKDAAPYMLDWFYSYRAYATLNNHTDQFPVTQCQKYLQYADLAYESILKYKYTDPELYEKLYSRINLETISIRYMMIEQYQTYIGNTLEVNEYVKQFRIDCAKFGIVKASEANSLDNVLKSWGW